MYSSLEAAPRPWRSKVKWRGHDRLGGLRVAGNQYWTNLFNLCSVSRRLSSSARRRSPSYRSVREVGEPAHVQQQKTCDKSRVQSEAARRKHSAAVCSNRAVIGGLMEDRAKLELSRQVQTERLEGCEGIPRGGVRQPRSLVAVWCFCASGSCLESECQHSDSYTAFLGKITPDSAS